MSQRLTISLSCEELSSGAAEERATFGLLDVTANQQPLTLGEDTALGELRRGPHIAGYPLAEWLAWNWWRLRWEVVRPSKREAREARDRWDFAHRMTTVGDGYVWPNIAIWSDGVQSFLDSEPSKDPDDVLFRYMGAAGHQTIPSAELEEGIDRFVEDILARLERENIRNTNLHRLWSDLVTERQQPDIACLRRLEAQLGYDPGEADEAAIHLRLRDASALGTEALGEIAADAARRSGAAERMISAREIAETAQARGFEIDIGDAAALTDAAGMKHGAGENEPWRIGEESARRLRCQEALDGEPVSNRKLAEFAGTTVAAIVDSDCRTDSMSFVFDPEDQGARLTLRPKRETGRRFELARLIGDRLLGGSMSWAGEPLAPATSTYSYRQKMQRAFAAELLAPFTSVEEMLAGDFSEDRQNDAAERFAVSPWMIQTKLVNHGLIDRDDAPDIADRGGN